VDDGWGDFRPFSNGATLQAQPLLAAFGALTAVAGVLAAGAGALEGTGGWLSNQCIAFILFLRDR
jgi:hypothetical protein